MTESNRKILNAAFLVVEFSLFAIFALLAARLYYAITHQAPISTETRLDNDFVPLILLFLLVVGACVFLLVFLIHFSVALVKGLKKKRAAANRFG